MTKKEKEAWTTAIESASRAINELIEYQSDLQGVYEEWSEKKQESEKGQAAYTIIETDLSGWDNSLNEIQGCLDLL